MKTFLLTAEELLVLREERVLNVLRLPVEVRQSKVEVEDNVSFINEAGHVELVGKIKEVETFTGEGNAIRSIEKAYPKESISYDALDFDDTTPATHVRMVL